jgi:GNAT superfamily N-acetyltransferase
VREQRKERREDYAMAPSEYDVIPYRTEFRPQVVSLMQYLWGDDLDGNGSYFQWKYEDNPYAESPLGMVALQKGEVVGFRGYFATRFKVCGRNDNLIVLFPGDTCVHPDHRRKGLSVIMGNRAMKEYAPNYRLFFNTTCTRNSLPGYQKMGFLPLAPKVYLTRCPLLGLIKYIPRANDSIPLSDSQIRFGQFGDILVSDQPRPKEMSSLVAAPNRAEGKIRLFQDEVFFRWRFRNQRNKYVFYYRMEEDIPTGYVVLGVSPNNRRGHILDYAEKESSALREILRYIIKVKHFDLLSIYEFCLDDTWMQTLKDLGFKTHSLVQVIERKLHGELPLLIRPVKETFAEDDFLIEGIDAREIENWSLKPICSDAV